ncbi:hypothetical protein EYF80_013113 [Liparis tanakae]|uniref:Uncharacterized protein n=1 Tax=Liparis tanakae TaxID=230148 RepID=A0A4Z2IFW7_9TELE|nr:hypothetical protein EYF80_013113 [Liparis tanakae]
MEILFSPTNALRKSVSMNEYDEPRSASSAWFDPQLGGHQSFCGEPGGGIGAGSRPFLKGGLRLRYRVVIVQVIVVGLHRLGAVLLVREVSVQLGVSLAVVLLLLLLPDAVRPLQLGAAELFPRGRRLLLRAAVAAGRVHVTLVVVKIGTLVARREAPPAGIVLLPVWGPAVVCGLLLQGVRGLALLGAALLGQPVGLVAHCDMPLDMHVGLHVHEDVGVGHHVSGEVAPVFALGCNQHSFAGVGFAAQVQGFVARCVRRREQAHVVVLGEDGAFDLLPGPAFPADGVHAEPFQLLGVPSQVRSSLLGAVTGGHVPAHKAVLFPRRENMASEVVVPGRLPARSSGSGPGISTAVDVADSDGAVRVDVVERRLQRARTRVGAVAILDPAVLEVRLQLGDVVVGL